MTEQAESGPDPTKAQMYEYRVVFADPQPPKEAEFMAVNDTHAISVTKDEYPNQKWTLYRKAAEHEIRVYAN